MKCQKFFALSFSLLFLCACEDFGYVEKAKYDQVARENADLKKQLAQKEDEIRNTPKHHYSLHGEGVRTFRFDADTGETCILLTTTSDWKNPDTKSEGCDCTDYLAKGIGATDNRGLKMHCGW